MKKINWKVRLKNQNFWIALIPAAFLLVQQVLAMFGIQMNFTETVDQLLEIINTVFVLLAILGIVNDPTTKTFADSQTALTYEAPKGE